MSKFRQLVEDITKPQAPAYTYLTPDHQALLDKEVEKATDWIDIRELPTAYYDNNPYDVEPQLIGTSGGWFLEDESYLWDAAIDIVIGWLEADGAVEYLYELIPADKQEDDEFNAALTKEAIEYLKNEKQHE
ncbi:MAG: hypothetical protein J5691_01245 [Bacilli bacterium]|nr:hypothetical protein [Bacilli bacterium]